MNYAELLIDQLKSLIYVDNETFYLYETKLFERDQSILAQNPFYSHDNSLLYHFVVKCPVTREYKVYQLAGPKS